VRIVFDQGTPVPLRRSLMHHEVTTAYPNWTIRAFGSGQDRVDFSPGRAVPAFRHRLGDATRDLDLLRRGDARNLTNGAPAVYPAFPTRDRKSASVP